MRSVYYIVVHRPITLGFDRPVTQRFQASLTVHFPTKALIGENAMGNVV